MELKKYVDCKRTLSSFQTPHDGACMIYDFDSFAKYDFAKESGNVLKLYVTKVGRLAAALFNRLLHHNSSISFMAIFQKYE